MKRKRYGKDGDIALKIDISKAYDRVDWGYLKQMMLRMGFALRWVEWIFLCVSSVSYSVLLNQDRVDPIQLGRGLRQGDPLSPYLFILVTEGLTTLIHRVVAMGDLHGVKVCRRAPILTHLLFADDCFLFFRATNREVATMKAILATYEVASGQAINYAKSEVNFSWNVGHADRETLAAELGVQAAIGAGRYLGVPSMVGRSKKSTFAYLKDRVWQRISSWSGRSLSKAGKEVMIKSVLQSIPSYVMSTYLIPPSVCDEIEKMMNSYWWGSSGDATKGIRWMSWERLSTPKSQGGMGFRHLHAFKFAMLGKQAWKLLTQPDLLVTKLLKVRWKIGNGASIRVWEENWILSSTPMRLGAPENEALLGLRVKDLIMQDQCTWNTPLIREVFSNEVASVILSMPLFDPRGEDAMLWGSNPREVHDWKMIWRLEVPPKVRHFLWRACKNCLPTRVRLRDKGVECPTICEMCQGELETTWHALLSCTWSRQCWERVELWGVINSCMDREDSFCGMFFEVARRLNKDDFIKFAMVLWSLWISRKEKVWNSLCDTPSQIANRAKTAWDEWHLANSISRPVAAREPRLVQSDGVWKAPRAGYVKINADAGFPPSMNVTTLGMCLRDASGNMLLARTCWTPSKLEVREGEAMGLLHAIQWANDLELDNVIFEVDAQSIVNSIKSTYHDISEGNW